MVAKSKKDQPCYTRKTKTGKSYVTCEGAQKREQKFAKHLKDLLSDKPNDKLILKTQYRIPQKLSIY